MILNELTAKTMHKFTSRILDDFQNIKEPVSLLNSNFKGK